MAKHEGIAKLDSHEYRTACEAAPGVVFEAAEIVALV